MIRGNSSEAYYKQFPVGFKRKRDAVQREKQRVSQRRYAKRRQQARALTNKALQLACGKGDASLCEELVGCSQEDFMHHMQQYAQGPIALRFYAPLSKFNLKDPQQLKQAFHYMNIYAVKRGTVRRRVPLTVEGARRMAGVWV